MQEKECSKCKVVRHLTDFWESKKEKDGRRYECKFCAREDAKKYRVYLEVKCQSCGITFNRRKDQMKEINNCQSCANKIESQRRKGLPLPAKRNGKNVNCSHCKKEIYRSKARISKAKNYFCSSECRAIYASIYFDKKNFIYSINNKGENNPRYKHGNRVGGHDRHKKLKKEIIKRDGEGCFICKGKENLHVHRVKANFEGGKYEVNNCVILCNIHHQWVHENYEKSKNMFRGDLIEKMGDY